MNHATALRASAAPSASLVPPAMAVAADRRPRDRRRRRVRHAVACGDDRRRPHRRRLLQARAGHQQGAPAHAARRGDGSHRRSARRAHRRGSARALDRCGRRGAARCGHAEARASDACRTGSPGGIDPRARERLRRGSRRVSAGALARVGRNPAVAPAGRSRSRMDLPSPVRQPGIPGTDEDLGRQRERAPARRGPCRQRANSRNGSCG